MEPQFLLDTNTASYIIKGTNAQVRQKLARIPIAQLAISAVTEGELRFGAARMPTASKLHVLVDDFLIRVTVLAWDSNCAREYGQLRAALEREGQPMGSLDMMIAAQALAFQLTLVTHDQSFSRIKRLKLEDWTK